MNGIGELLRRAVETGDDHALRGWDDEIGKLRRAATDPRRRVREVVALALQRLLAADRDRTAAALAQWAGDGDPLVVEPVRRLLGG